MPKNMNILWIDNRWPWHKKAFTKATAQYKLRKSLVGRPVDSLSQLLFHMAEGHQKKKRANKKIDISTGNASSHTMLTKVCGHLWFWDMLFLKTETDYIEDKDKA